MTAPQGPDENQISRMGAGSEAPKTSIGVWNGEGVRAENDFGAFWGRQNGSRCNTCRKFCIFPQILRMNHHQLAYWPSLSAPCHCRTYVRRIRHSFEEI